MRKCRGLRKQLRRRRLVLREIVRTESLEKRLMELKNIPPRLEVEETDVFSEVGRMDTLCYVTFESCIL